jgi:phage shock protein C
MTKLYRSNRDKKLFGVCGGLAEVTGIDSTIIRIILVITTFFSSGALILIYLIAALVMPKDPTYTPLGGSFYGSQQPNWNSNPQSQWNPHRQQPPYQPNPTFGQSTTQGFYPPNANASGSSIDDLMDDIEKKAMAKEIEELKAKLAKYENQNKGDE